MLEFFFLLISRYEVQSETEPPTKQMSTDESERGLSKNDLHDPVEKNLTQVGSSQIPFMIVSMIVIINQSDWWLQSLRQSYSIKIILPIKGISYLNIFAQSTNRCKLSKYESLVISCGLTN